MREQDQAGMLPWDTIETMDDVDIVGLDGFYDTIGTHKAGDSSLSEYCIRTEPGKR